ncbi:MAG: tetratricopeptide repeat protein [Nannocystaceae bacterium]
MSAPTQDDVTDGETRVLSPRGDDTVDVHAPIAEVPELPPGSTFGRYVVARTLGRGGMGVVYLAYDPQLDRGVALKVLRPGASLAERGVAQERLLREAQVMARLSHPNVVPVYDAGEVDGRVFVAMEHIEGRTISDWLAQERPRWPEVFDVFVAAGRGLAAAHERGLVHRDFKPDNVMIDASGRPRVMDFGLARAAEDEESGAAEAPSTFSELANGVSARISGTDSLTRTGFVLGTPAYMAPEQHLGAPLDPASDQFSFCVALYKGLYGERPFEGGTAAELCKAVLDGQVRPAPSATAIPGWLRRIVLRGLAPRPDARWPSMDALLEALTQRRRRAQRMRTGVPAVVLVGVAVAGGSWLQAQRDEPCQEGETTLASSWSDGRRESIRQAFVGTKLPFAEDAAERVTARIDLWGARWVDEYRDACAATAIRREQSGEALDLRMRCLRGRRRALEGVVSVLGSAEPGTVERAMTVVDQLPEPGSCADLELLRAQVRPPDDPALRERVEERLAALGRVDALLGAARFAEARAALDEIDADAAALEHAPLRVELEARRGSLLHAEGALDEAVSRLESTVWLAEAQGMDRMALRAAIELVRVVGVERDEHDRGEVGARLAEAKLERTGRNPRLEADLLRVRGSLADARGDYEQAAGLFEQSLVAWERIEPDGIGHALALGDFGKIHFRAGRSSEAAQAFERAAESLVAAKGPDHPDVGKAWGNAAAAWHRQGEYERARRGFESSLRVLEKAYGPDHPAVAIGLTNLGNVSYRTGDYAAAIEQGRRAIAIKQATLGAVHPKIGLNLNNIAMAQSKLGELEAALATYREADDNLAALGPDHIARVEPWIGEGEQLIHLERHAEAIDPLRRAVALQRAHDEEPTRLALPAFLLAQALWEGGGDRAEAVSLADEAGQLLVGAEDPDDQRLAQAVSAWRAEHASP